jgi:hypothetical protein
MTLMWERILPFQFDAESDPRTSVLLIDTFQLIQ